MTVKANNYDQLLHDIESQCDRLISDTQNMSQVMTEARKAQDDLYTVYQEVRKKATMGTDTVQVNVSSNAKDLIRNFPVG